MGKRVSRRGFIKLLAAAAGGAALGVLEWLGKPIQRGAAYLNEHHIYMPRVSSNQAPANTPTATSTPTATTAPTATSTPTATATQPGPTVPPPTGARVVHVHDTAATYWNGSENYFWNHIDQAVVDAMVDDGIKALTGKSTLAQAWSVVLPSYQVGQKIAIKVNFNNGYGCDYNVNNIDAVIQPVNAVVRGLKTIGVQENDIWVYDAIRPIPNRFVDGCQYSGVLFYDEQCRNRATFSSSDPDAVVSFSSPPAGVPLPPTQHISDVLIQATYLINMPIMKMHEMAGVTLGLKNHYGTINNPGGLHSYIDYYHDGQYVRSDYNPTVDINLNPHIRDKTILILADGLFGSKNGTGQVPVVWSTFGNQFPNSLFFAQDPVALDSVLCDFLQAEPQNGKPIPAGCDDYLALAAARGLGVYESGDPWGSGYSQIDYVKLER